VQRKFAAPFGQVRSWRISDLLARPHDVRCRGRS